MNVMRRLFWFWYACGLTLMLTYHVPKPFAFANGFFLFLYAVYAYKLYPRRALPLAVGVGLFTFGLEWVGVHTGWPFGQYAYSSELGWTLFGVPWTIACAWVGILWNVALLVPIRSRVLRALAIGLLAMSLDLVLDPVAFHRGWWVWDPTSAWTFVGVPWTNFAAWFGAFTFLGLLMPRIEPDRLRTRRARNLYIGMFIFFLALAWKDGLLFG